MLSPVQLKSSLEAAVQYNKDLNEEAVAFLEGRGISKEIAEGPQRVMEHFAVVADFYHPGKHG